jgi:hypothetical protein
LTAVVHFRVSVEFLLGVFIVAVNDRHCSSLCFVVVR